MTVNALPVAVAITGDTEVCIGSTITNLTSTAGTIVWSSSNTAVATIDAGTGVVTPVSAGSTNISYTVTDGNSCSATSANHAVTVNALPTIGGLTSVAIGSNITLTSTGGAGTWTSSVPTVATVDASGVVTGISSGSTAIIYTLTATGCSVSHGVGIGCTIPTIVSTSPDSNCGAGAVTLGATSSAGTINWYAASTGGASLGSGTSYTTTSLSSTTDYWIDATSNGCITTSRTQVTATINTIPTVSGSNTVCMGSSIILIPSVPGGIWSSSNTSIVTVNASTGEVTPITTGSANITYAKSGCVSLDHAVTVNALPLISVSGSNNPSSCVGSDGNIILSFTNVADGTYTIDYVDESSTAQSFTSVNVAGGLATISGLSVGVYNDLSITTNGCTSGGNVDITLSCANTPPVAVDDLSNSTSEDIPLTINAIGGNDTDVDGNVEPSTIILIDPNDATNTGDSSTPLVVAGVGTYTVDISGNVTFTPEADFNGSADVNYTIEDNDGLVSNTGLIAIVVNASNDAPVAVDDLSNSTSEDIPLTINAIGGNDTDVDGNVEPSTIILIDPNDATNTGDSSTPLVVAGVGTYTVDISGNVTFTPEADFNGSADVNYTIEDNDGLVSNVGTIGITVSDVNNPPVANDDAGSIDQGNVLIGSDLLANDSDQDGDALQITTTPVVDVAHGALVINTDGTYSYTPDAGFSGQDTFTYEVCDGNGGCITAIVTITVIPVNSDLDGDGISDEDEGDGDTDGDGIPDKEDTDSDNDGIPDADEGNEDTDNDGVADYVDEDSDADGIPDFDEGDRDTDGDGIPDYQDLDSDNDGITDDIEAGDDWVLDCDDDGTPNYLDQDRCSIIVPLGFSPNGDYDNDLWIIEGINQYAGNKVKVYNRWGNLVYEKDGYDNEMVVWTGQSEGKLTIGGQEVTDGSYFYVIELGDSSKPIRGYVVVKR